MNPLLGGGDSRGKRVKMECEKKKYRPRVNEKNRDEVITVRLSSSNMSKLKRAFKKSKDENFYDFLLKQIMSTFLVEVNYFEGEVSVQGLEESMEAVEKVGKRVNELTKQINQRKNLKKEWLDEILKNLQDLYLLLRENCADYWRCRK